MKSVMIYLNTSNCLPRGELFVLCKLFFFFVFTLGGGDESIPDAIIVYVFTLFSSKS